MGSFRKNGCRKDGSTGAPRPSLGSPRQKPAILDAVREDAHPFLHDTMPAARATGDSPKGRRVGVYTDLERHGMSSKAEPARQHYLRLSTSAFAPSYLPY